MAILLGCDSVGLLGQRDALDDSATVHRAVVGDAPEYEWAASPRVHRVERGRMAAVTEERRRNTARKELAWLARGAQARSTKP